jgi:hypothetical protein
MAMPHFSAMMVMQQQQQQLMIGGTKRKSQGVLCSSRPKRVCLIRAGPSH